MTKSQDMKPILFNTDMVRAILDGRKTQTRRPFKEMVDANKRGGWLNAGSFYNVENTNIWWGKESGYPLGPFKSQYHIGDILYVRETFAVKEKARPTFQCTLPMFEYIHFGTVNKMDSRYELVYKAGLSIDPDFPIKWRPSIHMPKDFARIFLKVKGAWAERAQDITPQDAKAEGMLGDICIHGHDVCSLGCGVGPRYNFMRTINAIYPNAWENNIWNFAYSFERCEKP